MSQVILHEGKEKSLWRRHPWVYDNAIAKVEGKTPVGSTVSVISHDGKFLAKGAFSPDSTLRVRLWTLDEHEVIDHAFFKRRVAQAIAHRRCAGFGIDPNGAIRWLFGEADGLPGCIADQYADILVVQFLAAGVERHRQAIISALEQHLSQHRPVHGIYERSDGSGRSREGLSEQSGWIKAPEKTESTRVKIQENGLWYWVDVATGHKTGWYLDQAAQRTLCAELIQQMNTDRVRVLNTFCYTGGFSLSALKGAYASQKHIELISVDASQDALNLAQENMKLNEEETKEWSKNASIEWIKSDVFDYLKQCRLNHQAKKAEDSNSSNEGLFDLIVLDPPKFASSSRQIDQAARAYKQINLEALKLLKPGGVLLTFSCSGAIDTSLFRKIVAGAVADARIDCVIEKQLSQPLDHPIHMAFPEGEYLKGLLLRKIG